MQYILLIYGSETKEPQPGTPEFDAMMAGFMAFSEKVETSGKFIAGEALHPVAMATTVTRENGTIETMDGPFAETKEQLGGFYLLDCDNLDEALSLAAEIPVTGWGRVEVRPIMTFEEEG